MSYTAYFAGAGGTAADPVHASCSLVTASDSRIATETAEDVGFGSYPGVHGSAVLALGPTTDLKLRCTASKSGASSTWSTGNNLSVTIEPLHIVTRAALPTSGALSSAQKKQQKR